MKKRIVLIVAGLSGLALLLFLAGFYLLDTESGTHFLVAQAEKQLDGDLHIGSSSGKVLDRIELTDILFESSSGKAKIGRLVLDWKSTDLLRLHLHILELSAEDIFYTAIPQPHEPEAEESKPLILPELSLPVTMTIERLQIENFVFLSAPDAKPLTVDKAGLALFWDKDGIQLQELDIAMAEATLQMQGVVTPTGNYPLQLTTNLQTLDPELPSLKLLGEYEGDLQKLLIKEKISGDIGAELNLTVMQPIDALTWQGHIEIKELLPALFSPEIAGVLTGVVQSSGNLQHADLTATLAMRDDTGAEFNWDAELDVQANLETLLITVNQLKLMHAHTPALIELGGTADIDGPLDLTLRWQEFQWPLLAGKAEYQSTRGNLALTGSVDDYHLTMNTEVSGSGIPEAILQLTAEGNTKSVNNLRLTANLLEGVVNVGGKVQWSPAVEWQLQTDATNINPGIQYSQWPGKLNWLIQTRGAIEEAGVVTDVALEYVEGILRQLPVTGKGQIHITPDTIQVNDLHLSSGDAVFTAQGTLGNESTLDWKADVVDFSDLLPESGGQLQSTGSVQGEMSNPRLTVDLSASAITLPHLGLEQLQADIDLDLSGKKAFSLDVSGTNLSSGENRLADFALQGNGTMEEHTVQLLANHDLAQITLGLNGGYLQEQWHGMLDRFNINTTDFGAWQLQEPAAVTAGPTAANLERMCLGRSQTDICVSGSWNSDNSDTKGNVQISQFPLAWLSPWLPETVENLDGMFSLQADAKMEEKLLADVSAEITPGTITYLTDMGEEHLPHQGMNLILHVAEDGLNAAFSLSVDSNTISGNLKSPDLLQTGVGGKAKLDGKLFIDAKKFDTVEALIPAIQDLNAAIAMDFTVQGTLEHPDINGKGIINIPYVLIPAAGLDLTDTTMDILADNTGVRLSGKFNSPKGYMELDGKAILESGQNWPLRLTLKSDNFRLINLPESQVFLNSDLLLEKKNGTISLSGTATIPRAEVLLRELPPGSETTSPDVVILQEKKEEVPTSPLKMKLKVTLGNDVHFVGLGFNAFIDGQLTMTAEPEEQIQGSGAFHIKQGSYRAYGQDLEIQTGVISFPGGPLTQPGINLRATRTVGNIVAGISAIGPVGKPRITTFSNPPMPESQTLSYLLTGSAPENAGSSTKLSIGRQINNKLSISVGTDVTTGDSGFIARYRLNRKIHIQTTTATNSNAADIFYTVELGGEEETEELSAE
ncbi:MAG: translocation/assembly module TamB domain-containing protein [Desulfocapsa sp.]|nr:translocation/assembly module TamB domain-containing protein [Desulfocapsa sp.]